MINPLYLVVNQQLWLNWWGWQLARKTMLIQREDPCPLPRRRMLEATWLVELAAGHQIVVIPIQCSLRCWQWAYFLSSGFFESLPESIINPGIYSASTLNAEWQSWIDPINSQSSLSNKHAGNMLRSQNWDLQILTCSVTDLLIFVRDPKQQRMKMGTLRVLCWVAPPSSRRMRGTWDGELTAETFGRRSLATDLQEFVDPMVGDDQWYHGYPWIHNSWRTTNGIRSRLYPWL